MHVFRNDKQSSTPQLPGVQLQRSFSTQKRFWSQSFPWGLRLGTQLYKASKISHLEFFLTSVYAGKKNKYWFWCIFYFLSYSIRSDLVPAPPVTEGEEEK